MLDDSRPAGRSNADAINDFARGFVSGFYDQSNSNKQGLRDKFFSAFVQDDFKMTRNFTFNVGLRYDYGSPLTEILNRVNTFRPGEQSTVFPTAPVGLVFPGDPGISRSTYSPDRNNFGPRIGFAWDPTGKGKLSIRSGFGVFYNVPETELALQFLGAAPYGAQVVALGSTDMTHPYQTASPPLAQNPFPFKTAKPGDKFDFTTVAPVSLTRMDPNFRTPYAFQYDLQVQYQIARRIGLRMRPMWAARDASWKTAAILIRASSHRALPYSMNLHGARSTSTTRKTRPTAARYSEASLTSSPTPIPATTAFS